MYVVTYFLPGNNATFLILLLLFSTTQSMLPIGFTATPYGLSNFALEPLPSLDPPLHVPAVIVPELQAVEPAIVETCPTPL